MYYNLLLSAENIKFVNNRKMTKRGSGLVAKMKSKAFKYLPTCLNTVGAKI